MRTSPNVLMEPATALRVAQIMLLLPLSLLLSCGSTAEPAVPEPPAAEIAPPPLARAEVARAGYQDARARLEATRVRLAERYDREPDARSEVLEEARETVFVAITSEFMPAWEGTPWDFYGTSIVPGEGHIACGYYASTVLEHASFDVERVLLAQQASENIIKTFTPAGDIHRFRRKPASDVVKKVSELGPGLFIVGLDYHVGFLVNDGEEVQMCHSSYLGTAAVLCEDAEASDAMVSDYRVIGKLLDDRMLRRWLEGGGFETVQ